MLSEMIKDMSADASDSEENIRIVNIMKEIIHKMTECIKGLRESELSLNRALKKFKDIAGDQWRQSRYFPLISSLSVSRYDVQQNIKSGLGLINDYLLLLSLVNGSADMFNTSNVVNLCSQLNYHEFDQSTPWQCQC